MQMIFLETVNKIAESFFDLIFPKFCIGCKKEGFYICQDCKSRLQINYYVFCHLCKNRIPADSRCPSHKTALKFCLSPFSYDNILVKNLIHDFKYHFIKSIGPELAKFMIQSLKNSKLLNHLSINKLMCQQTSELIIVPVPLHKKRLIWRGFNQSEILAKKISKELQIDIFSGLKRVKNTLPQIDMADKEQRQENIKNAFLCEKSRKLKHKIVILIDDMVTTGATLEECAKTLKKNGAKEVWALTVAK